MRRQLSKSWSSRAVISYRWALRGILRWQVRGSSTAGVKSKQKFRYDVNGCKQANLHANIVKCFGRSDQFLPLARIRKFACKTRAYCRAYQDSKPNSLADIEKLIKVYKSHRSAEVSDKKFCHE